MTGAVAVSPVGVRLPMARWAAGEAAAADDASPFTEAITGSVPGDLLTTAPCPLAGVPRREWTTPASAPVVVAVDQETSRAALAAVSRGAAQLAPGAHGRDGRGRGRSGR